MAEVSKITGEVRIPGETLLKLAKKITNAAEFRKEIESSLSSETTEVFSAILTGALNLGASDIHIEPEENGAKIRARLDGILQDITGIETKIYSPLLSRVKLLSGLKLNISARPQDGLFSVSSENSLVEIRSSILPSQYGESMVLRILNPKNIIGLEELGLRPDLLATLKKEIKKPNGMIIATGPTGSGKTTTLYAFLALVQKPEIKIITIEDPIEYHLKGISQTQVDAQKGYDFASGLKSIMRQDPDVILVGEIRDLETANIALQAALTGHLVFSTLHTNDASGAVARLQSLGEKAMNIAPAVSLIVAQRLARKVCQKCAKFEKAGPQITKKIKTALGNIKKSVKVPLIGKNAKLPMAIGCKNCNFTGYRGRVGIFEALLIDDELENLILKSPSIAALKKAAIKKGMVTIYQDGVIKALEGITTLEEVERVVGE